MNNKYLKVNTCVHFFYKPPTLINLNADFISEGAKKKLEKVGGTITLIQKS